MTPKGRWILAATILGSSMAMIDGTVVNIALPALQEHMGATIATVMFLIILAVVSFYLLVIQGSMFHYPF